MNPAMSLFVSGLLFCLSSIQVAYAQSVARPPARAAAEIERGVAAAPRARAGVPLKAVSFALSPSSVDFGNVPVGTRSPSHPITFTNTGTESLNIGSSSSVRFTHTLVSCTQPVPPGSSCHFDVQFNPGVTGPVDGTLSVTGNSSLPNSGIGPTLAVNLHGTGVATAATSIAAVPGAPITGSPGQPVSRPLQVRVSDAQANPVSGESVTWSVNNPGASPGTFGSNPTLSNAQGIATNTFTYGSDGAGRSFRACLTARPTACAEFSVAPGAGSPSSVAGVSPRIIQASISAATTQLISYSFATGVAGVTPADGIFCTRLTIPLPAAGITATYPCASNSEFARHPAGGTNFQTVLQGANVARATETIRIPAPVVRAAQGFGASTFYFVRSFAPTGFAVIEIHANGAVTNAPIALSEVRLGFETTQGPQPLVFVGRGAPLPPATATLYYSGSGVLRGRWELVVPGDIPPTDRDLLSEASLPRSERGTQRRYRLLERFDRMLPGAGTVELRLPSLGPALGATQFDGQYQLLFRIEAEPSIHGGESGAAPFAMPSLRYFVGSAIATSSAIAPITATLQFAGTQPRISWGAVPNARYYRIEVVGGDGAAIYSGIVRERERTYQALPDFRSTSNARWHVQALDEDLRTVGQSEWAGIPSR